MDSSAIPVFLAGPFPILHTSRVDEVEEEIELDVALLIAGLPNVLASTVFPLDESWQRIRRALESGDARLGVAGLPHQDESEEEEGCLYPSAYIGLECANGERLVLAHIRGLDPLQPAEAYAREVIDSILQGCAPEELGITIDD
ncbi:MAG TPA: hypothetical protein VK939_04430 [Longimicrobiales bacterium]|nr:hypothetical protein [Longimicrobiales bacterium]